MSLFTESVESNLKGVEAVSTGLCPGCDKCREQQGFDNIEALNTAIENGDAYDEDSFSSAGCDICGSNLAGDMQVWHGIIDGQFHHWDNACVDCVYYLANGEEPEQWS